jgi:hypothetical protein
MKESVIARGGSAMPRLLKNPNPNVQKAPTSKREALKPRSSYLFEHWDLDVQTS